MAARSRDADRTVGGMVLAVLGAILAVHTLWRLSASGPGDIVVFLLGTVPGLLLALLLLTVGLWMIESGPPGSYARRLLAWAVTSGLFGALSASLFVIDPRGAVVTVRLQRVEREGGMAEDWLAQAG